VLCVKHPNTSRFNAENGLPLAHVPPGGPRAKTGDVFGCIPAPHQDYPQHPCRGAQFAKYAFDLCRFGLSGELCGHRGLRKDAGELVLHRDWQYSMGDTADVWAVVHAALFAPFPSEATLNLECYRLNYQRASKINRLSPN
jgi:hypothetical protein